MEFLKKFIVVILLAVLIVSYIPPQDTSAQSFSDTSIFSDITNAFSCVTGGVLAKWLLDKLNDWIWKWSTKGGLREKIASWFNTNVPVNDEQISQYSLQGLTARCVARVILNHMTGGIIAATRTSGRDGWASFVRDWRNFKAQAQYRGENIFRAVLSQTNLCPQIDRQIKTLFGATNRQSLTKDSKSIYTRIGDFDPFQSRNNCTLPSSFSLPNYLSNFAANGGWEAFSRLTQPQNNFFGTLANALDEAHRQRDFEEKSNISEAESGGGFTSRRGKDANDSCLIWDQNGRDCLVGKDIMTPGGSLKDSVNAIFQNELAWLTNVQNLQGIIQNLTNRLMSRILDLAGDRPGSAVIGGNPPKEAYPGFYEVPDPNISSAPIPVVCAPGDPACSVIPDVPCPYPVPNELTVVQRFASLISANTCPLTGSTTPPDYRFTDAVVTALHAIDPNFGYTGFGASEISTDTIDYWNPANGAPVNGQPACHVDIVFDCGPGGANTPVWPGAVLDQPGTYYTYPRASGTSLVTLCTDINYGGVCHTFTSNVPDMRFTVYGDLNDNTRSIRVPAGMSVELCADINYGVPCQTFTSDQPDLTNPAIISFIYGTSSFRITGLAGGVGDVTICAGINSGPPCIQMNIGQTIADMNSTPIGIGTSSFTINNPARVTLCTGVNLGGTCHVFNASIPDLRFTFFGDLNDTTLSIVVGPGPSIIPPRTPNPGPPTI